MTAAETLDRARQLFVGDTQGDRLAREVIGVAEQSAKMAALWEHLADQRAAEIAERTAQRNELWELVKPVRDAVLFARAQRRPMGIGQESEIGRPTVTLGVCPRYGRETDNPGFHLSAEDLGPEDADSPSPTKRIALALLRLAYAVADKASLRP